ncbi:MAG: hypothetical protein EZS28_000934 [Streblomastix strix]|uniref:Uncharacterized protein n=1 Tax=Streblomastix strix TaxID=222440 RepID=A0A5J4X8Q1_9EUKA|nr:MAG: hypothetical protein EZS28_000934 [Streblomastix strix]
MIVPLTQTDTQIVIMSYPNQIQSLILKVDFMRMIKKSLLSSDRNIILIDCRRDSICLSFTQRDFPTEGNVRRVASSTDSIVSGQVGVAGIKPINIYTELSMQLQGNPIREPKVQKKKGTTHFKDKVTTLTARCEPMASFYNQEFGTEQRKRFIHWRSFLGRQWRKYYNFIQK